MSKHIVSYMRKKNRALGQEDVVKDLCSPAVLDTSSSKRSRAQSNAHKVPTGFKKPKTSMIGDLQTPCPTALSESIAFKLQSSRGQLLSPDHEFSPVPPAAKSVFNPNPNTMSSRRAYMKRSTRFLKENDSSGTVSQSRPASRSRSRARNSVLGSTQLGPPIDICVTGRARINLASPFCSRPSSPTSLPCEGAGDNLIPGASHDIVSKERAIRTDTTSPARSLQSSPTHDDDSITTLSSRRPSAPTSSRPKLEGWTRLLPQVSKSSFQEAISGRESGLLPSALKPSSICPEPISKSTAFGEREKWTWSDAAVDFNRPPSQLSFHADLFQDVQCASTPLRDIKRHQMSRYLADEQNDQEMDINQLTLRSLFSSPSVLNTDDNDSSRVPMVSDSWISDSLISTPSIYRNHGNKYRLEWRARNEDAYSDEDEDEETHVLDHSNHYAGIDTGALSIRTQSREERTYNSVSNVPNLTAADTPEEAGLVLGARNLSIKDSAREHFIVDGEPLLVPDSCYPPSTDGAGSRTTFSGDASERASGAKPPPLGRARRGTIRAAEMTSQPQKATQARRTRSGTIVGLTSARRTRSGTIVGPALQVRGIHTGMKVKSTTSTQSDGGDQVMSYSDSISGIIRDDEDELDSFKKEWVDEPWTVADPPSPVASRTRKNARSAWAGKVQPIHKRVTIKQPQFGLQEGVAENAGEESDDELLLK